MKLMVALLAVVLAVVVMEAQAQWHRYPIQAGQGAMDMYRAYRDMRKANWKHSDKYFHARGNYDAAKRGPGGRWAARVISDGREWVQARIGRGHQDAAADQFANRWGRSGRNPNIFRPRGLPGKY